MLEVPHFTSEADASALCRKPRTAWLALALLLGAYWYCAVLYVHRVVSGAELFAELFAGVTALAFLVAGRKEAPLPRGGPGLLAIPVLLWAISFGSAPELASLLLAVLSAYLFLWQFGITRQIGILGLLFLSTPVLSRLPLFLGYPLRIATGILAAPLLNIAGCRVVREGTIFRLGDRLIIIDAPCSGTNMLWGMMWFTLTLCVFRRLSSLRTLLACGCSLLIAVFANAIRSSSLVFAEVHGIELSQAAHAGVGVCCFLAALIAISWLVFQLPEAKTQRVIVGTTASAWRVPDGIQWTVFVLACGYSAMTPLFAKQTASTSFAAFPGWPTELSGRELRPVPLQDYEKRYAAGFPGQMARFSDGSRQIMLQWLPTHSRSVHSAAECLRNAGFEVVHGPILIDEESMRWSSATAMRNGVAIRLKERIEDASGQHWQDVSAWYWDAILGRAHGPYWIHIVTEKQGTTE